MTKLTIAAVQARVCARYGLVAADMWGPSHARRIARPRQVAMYLARSLTDKSLNQIGRRFARHHATIIHACRQVERLRVTEADLDAAVRSLTSELSAPTERQTS